MKKKSGGSSSYVGHFFEKKRLPGGIDALRAENTIKTQMLRKCDIPWCIAWWYPEKERGRIGTSLLVCPRDNVRNRDLEPQRQL